MSFMYMKMIIIRYYIVPFNKIAVLTLLKLKIFAMNGHEYVAVEIQIETQTFRHTSIRY